MIMRCIRHIIVVLLIIIAIADCFAQTLSVDDIRALPNDLSASVYQRNDFNGTPCALIKVAFPKAGAEFEGNVIGTTEYKAGEYWVYLTANSKFLKMKHAEYSPLMIQFDDNTVGPVESKRVYGVKVSAGAAKQPVTFKITPAKAILIVDQKDYSTTNGIVEIMLSPEEHTYVVFSEGYKTQGGKFLVDEDNTNKIIVELDPRAPSEGGGQTPQNEVNNSGNGVGRDFVETAAGLNMNMVYVAGGMFMMGASASDSEAEGDEKPAHSVTLSGYYIGKYEVTQKQWVEIMGANPSFFKGDDLPVERVSWNDVQEFIRKLNVKTGKNYRLPTEAEWEFAARGGNSSQGYKYSGSNRIDEVAWWYDGNSGDKTHPVGTKSPNELGIYDMTGNVCEWCSDWYDGNYYDNLPSTNPKGPSSGADRVLRGGRWSGGAADCRVSYRGDYLSPGFGDNDCGFRLALDAK